MTTELDFPEIKDLSPEEFEATADELVDQIEESIAKKLVLVDLPVSHQFTPGIYIREIFMPAGVVLTSRTHKYEHPFVISKGVVSVWSLQEGAVTYRAPHTGVTKPGTRRVLLVHEDTIWTTFHVNEDDIEDPDEIVARVTEPHHNLRMESALLGRPESERLRLNSGVEAFV
jgi:hypothetical protein